MNAEIEPGASANPPRAQNNRIITHDHVTSADGGHQPYSYGEPMPTTHGNTCPPLALPGSVNGTGGEQSPRHFRRHLVRAAMTGEWAPWSEFVDRAWRATPRGVQVTDSVKAWRRARPLVLRELADLGLTATIERTDGPVPIEEHEADLAGLVRLRAIDGAEAAAAPPELRPTERAYAERMAERWDLHPHRGLPTSVRGFCGQSAPFERPGWTDHAHTWADSYGDPVLTVEPYTFGDPAAVVRELAELPLLVDGPYFGVWHDATKLLVLRWDPDAEVLPADHDTTEEIQRWVA